jgi:energy-converting hydrogenase B subunit Q
MAAGPGILHALTGVIAGHSGDIVNCSIIVSNAAGARIYFEVRTPDWEPTMADLRALPVVRI